MLTYDRFFEYVYIYFSLPAVVFIYFQTCKHKYWNDCNITYQEYIIFMEVKIILKPTKLQSIYIDQFLNFYFQAPVLVKN